jgi:hypothetical protein
MMRKKEQSEWSATYAVAAELTRRGYRVGWPMGNAPVKDLLVESPDGLHFYVDVKGAIFPPRRKGNSEPCAHCYLIQESRLKSEPDTKLFFVFVAIPPNLDQCCEYAVLSHRQLQELDRTETETSTGLRKDGRPYAPWPAGVDHRWLAPYLGKWEGLPK